MSVKSNKNKRQKKTITVLVTILIVLIGILIFGFVLKNDDDGEKQPANTVSVETPYCSLFYPDKWKDVMTTEVDEQNGYIITFIGEVNGNQAKLFSVSFGESDSVQIGTLITEDEEEIPVGVEFFTLEETMEWKQEDVEIALDMRDAGNELVKYLMEKESFQSVE